MLQGINFTNTVRTTSTTVHFSQPKCQIHMCSRECVERERTAELEEAHLLRPRSQGLSSRPPLVVGKETLVAAGHVTIYPSQTTGWVGTQVHLVERTIKYHTLPGDFSTIQILGGHVTSRNQGSLLTTKGRREERPWERGCSCCWRASFLISII